MANALYIQDHVVHFYVLHALDWVDVVSALKADPAEASKIAQSISFVLFVYRFLGSARYSKALFMNEAGRLIAIGADGARMSLVANME